jgi:hypothetical protein
MTSEALDIQEQNDDPFILEQIYLRFGLSVTPRLYAALLCTYLMGAIRKGRCQRNWRLRNRHSQRIFMADVEISSRRKPRSVNVSVPRL